jgi:glutathione synthase/RimK-type ligase-like ATP-grasp enzyme
VDDGLIKICIAAAKAVGGGGVLGIDVFECPDPNGYLLIKDQRYIYKINEINGTTQFKNSSGPIGIDLADYIARYAIQQARISARSR